MGNSSGLWKHALILTLLFSFTVMIVGGYAIYRSRAPIPEQVVGPDGNVLFTAADIQQGQELFRKRGLMDYGSVLGHGAYLGPDYTAEALHWMVEGMRAYHSGGAYAMLGEERKAAVDAAVARELKQNRYDAREGILRFTAAQAEAWRGMVARYAAVFQSGDPRRALPKGALTPRANGGRPEFEREAARRLAAFLTWTAWLAAAERPGTGVSYTNNWPYEEAAGNRVTAASLWWSAVSVAALLFFLALILYLQHRYRLSPEDAEQPPRRFGLPALTPSQRAAAKFFVAALLLFLAQALLGGKLAHDYADGASFYGLPLSDWLPFNIARGWHLQLAIFWIATAWLGMGIFIAPLAGGSEPRWQKPLVDVLFWALVAVVGGSLASQYLAVKGFIGDNWWWLGTQGWEYLELGRLWMLLLIAGMGIWLCIVWRGLRSALRAESDRGGLTHLLFYSAVAIPVFYGFALFIQPDSHITMADYWRWWLIHLWVEGIFEVFAVVVIGFLMVRLGLVTAQSTLRALYFQLIILLGSGIIGTGHHYYWIGAPEMWIALGSVFSALEVIPLSLLMVEAYGQYKVIRDQGSEFPYRAAFWFLVATAFWNLFGAGVLGFLINLPFVNYFQHGSFLTAAHGHGALMGVYGMLAIALALYSLRNLVQPRHWKEKWIMTGFWGLNAGLMGMIATTLFPVGVLQLLESFRNGFWSARAFAFYEQPLVHTLLWLRIVPDSVFLVVGVVPLVAAAVWGFLHLRPAEEEADVVRQLQREEEEIAALRR